MRAYQLAVLALLCLPVGQAFGGVLWTADWLNVKPNVLSDDGDNQILVNKPPLFNGDGNESMIAATLTVGLPFNGESDSFTNQNYALQLTLKDTASGESVVMDFSGDLTGTISPGGSSITNEYDVDNTTHEADLGGRHYTVTMLPFDVNGEGTDIGVMYAEVTVTGGESPDPTPTNDTPEPTTALLAATGAAFTMLWKRRRIGA